MDFFQTVSDRKSIFKYKSDEVKKESIKKMIEAAMRAPSWKNRSSFRIIVVEDKNIKDSLADTIMNKDDKAANAVKEAPMAIVVIGKPEESGEVEGKEFYLVDGAIAMEHIILGATAEGYGSLWIGAIDEEKAKDILKVSSEYKIIGITPVGLIEEENDHYPMKTIDDFVFINSFGDPYK